MSSPKFDFPRSLLIFGNLAILAWILLASLSLMYVDQLYGWLFLLFAAATIFLILRRLGCSSCYNCKSCTSGFGRLAGWFFGKRELKDTENKTALGFVIFVYCLLGLVPAVLLAVSVVQVFSLIQSLILICILGISMYSLATWRKTPKPKT